MHPVSHRPPLALGGHCFVFKGAAARCLLCCAHLPSWAVTERLWTLFVDRWCTGVVRALPAGDGQLTLAGVA
jgi:hypothetical protein